MKNPFHPVSSVILIAIMFYSGSHFFPAFDHHKVLIIAILTTLVLIDYTISIALRLSRYVMLQTKSDIYFRLLNILIGIAGILSFIYFRKQDLFTAWLSSVVGFVGLINGIAYQNSIQFRNKSNRLVFDYLCRPEKVIENPDFVEFNNNRLTLRDKDRVIEINNLKNTEKNKKLLAGFFKREFPHAELIIKG